MEFPKSRILTTKQLIDQIRESNRNGERFCFILGAGASVDSKKPNGENIPSGKELEMTWMNCIMGEADDGDTPAKNPVDMKKTAEAFMNEYFGTAEGVKA